MANIKIVNIWGNTAADIGTTSGSDPTLRLWNTGTGQGAQVDAAGTIESLLVTQNAVGGATIAPLRIAASLASQAAIAFSGVFISTASISQVGGGSAFVIPVYHESQKIWGFINVSKGVV